MRKAQAKPLSLAGDVLRGRGWNVSVAAAMLLSLVFAGLAGAGDASTRASAVQPPVNRTPPSITGKAQEGQVLRADQGRWRGLERKTGKFTFQWRVCGAAGLSCADVAKANDRIYVLRAGDVGHTLRVVVTASDPNGSTSSSSLQTGLVSAAPSGAPVATVRPTIGGKAEQGAVLTAQAGAWAGTTPVQIAYQWRRCGALGGACQVIAHLARTAKSYSLRNADVGKTVRVLLTEQNQVGTSAALSDPTAKVTPASPASGTVPRSTSAPTIAGTAQQGKTVNTTTGSWSGTPPITFAFQWVRCGTGGGHCRAIAGATRQSYTAAGADVRRTLRVRVTARNSAGASSVFSGYTRPVVAASVPVSPAPPKNTGQPTISGAAVQGSTLTTSNGNWAGTPPFTFQYRWLRCDTSGGGLNGGNCANISGETRQTYVLTGTDVGHRIRSRVIATNQAGSASFNSNATNVVKVNANAGPPKNAQPPTISGTAVANSTLTANKGSWIGAQTISYAYEWLRCDKNGGSCSSISGATVSTYLLKSVDVGTALRVRITARNGQGTATATSAPRAVISKASPPPGVVSINDVALPNRLIIDQYSFQPNRLRKHGQLIARFHVSDSRNHSVVGALVFVEGVPLGQVLPSHAERPTGPDGYATFVLRASNRLQFRGSNRFAFFLRARKEGENPLGGVTARRLVAVRLG